MRPGEMGSVHRGKCSVRRRVVLGAEVLMRPGEMGSAHRGNLAISRGLRCGVSSASEQGNWQE